MWRDTQGWGKHGSTHRAGAGSGNSKQNFLAFILVSSSPGRIKGSLVLSASLGRLINMCKGHTQRERPPVMDLQMPESLFSRRVMKQGVENIPWKTELDDPGHEEHSKERAGLVWGSLHSQAESDLTDVVSD